MCTAVSFCADRHYFGRTLDYEVSFGEQVTVTPRNFPLNFREAYGLDRHYAIIGMAAVREEYPLYFDAMNEKGLCMAGLNFPGNAVYKPCAQSADNIASFELIPWILGQCASIKAARRLLDRLNVCDIPFREDLPLSPLHWMLSDAKESVVIEPMAEGVRIIDNPVGVLTNNPPFEMQMRSLQNYAALSNEQPTGGFGEKFGFSPYSRGMGGIGLPGDHSSASRFVRAAFVKAYSVMDESAGEGVSQFFHILDSVAVPRGCVKLDDGKFVTTRYSSCCDTERGVYLYTTYGNRQISAVDMYKVDLDGKDLVTYPLVEGERVHQVN